MRRFTYTTTLPSLNRVEEVKELNFSTYKHLVKCITNDNNLIITAFFNELVASLCSNDTIKYYTFLDKLIVLLMVRAVCLAPDLELNITCPETGNTFKYTIAISDIIDKLQNLNLPNNVFSQVNTYNNLEIELGMPNALYIDTDTPLLDNLVKRITVNGKDVEVTEQVLDNLPVNILNDIKNYLKNLNLHLNDINILEIISPFGRREAAVQIPLNIFSGSIIEFLKLAYKRDLISLYELEYTLLHKLNIDYELVKNSTPAELLTYINIFKEEKREEEKAQKATQPLNPLQA